MNEAQYITILTLFSFILSKQDTYNVSYKTSSFITFLKQEDHFKNELIATCLFSLRYITCANLKNKGNEIIKATLKLYYDLQLTSQENHI